MIKGVGIDVVEVERIAHAMWNKRFVERILTEHERSLGLSAQTVAGRWAAKEAVAKAVGLHLHWHDVEILNDDKGRPIARVVNGEIEGQLHVSISHEKGIAAAVAVWET